MYELRADRISEDTLFGYLQFSSRLWQGFKQHCAAATLHLYKAIIGEL